VFAEWKPLKITDCSHVNRQTQIPEHAHQQGRTSLEHFWSDAIPDVTRTRDGTAAQNADFVEREQ